VHPQRYFDRIATAKREYTLLVNHFLGLSELEYAVQLKEHNSKAQAKFLSEYAQSVCDKRTYFWTTTCVGATCGFLSLGLVMHLIKGVF